MSLDAVIAQLKSSDVGIRVEAAKLLGKSQSVSAFTSLVEALRDSEREVRKAVVQALGELGDLRAIDPLIELWNDEVFGELEEDWQLPNPIEETLVKFGLPAVEQLLPYIDNHIVMAALGRIGDSRALQPLLQIVETPPHDLYDRQCALAALGHLKDPKAFDVIASYVRHQSSGATAIYALASLGDPRAVPVLEELLYRPVVHSHANAEHALLSMGTEEALDALIKFAEQAPPRRRIDALWVLSYLKNEKVEKLFVEVLHTANDEQGWSDAVRFFLINDRLQFLEEMKKDLPEPVIQAIQFWIKRFKS